MRRDDEVHLGINFFRSWNVIYVIFLFDLLGRRRGQSEGRKDGRVTGDMDRRQARVG